MIIFFDTSNPIFLEVSPLCMNSNLEYRATFPTKENSRETYLMTSSGWYRNHLPSQTSCSFVTYNHGWAHTWKLLQIRGSIILTLMRFEMITFKFIGYIFILIFL